MPDSSLSKVSCCAWTQDTQVTKAVPVALRATLCSTQTGGQAQLPCQYYRTLHFVTRSAWLQRCGAPDACCSVPFTFELAAIRLHFQCGI